MRSSSFVSNAMAGGLDPRVTGSEPGQGLLAWTRESGLETRRARWTTSPKAILLEVVLTVAPDRSVQDVARLSTMPRGLLVQLCRGTSLASIAILATNPSIPALWPPMKQKSTAKLAMERILVLKALVLARELGPSAWDELANLATDLETRLTHSFAYTAEIIDEYLIMSTNKNIKFVFYAFHKSCSWYYFYNYIYIFYLFTSL